MTLFACRCPCCQRHKQEWLDKLYAEPIQTLPAQPKPKSVSDEELERIIMERFPKADEMPVIEEANEYRREGFIVGYRAAEAKQAWPSEDEVKTAAIDYAMESVDSCHRVDFTAGVRWLKQRMGA